MGSWCHRWKLNLIHTSQCQLYLHFYNKTRQQVNFIEKWDLFGLLFWRLKYLFFISKTHFTHSPFLSNCLWHNSLRILPQHHKAPLLQMSHIFPWDLITHPNLPLGSSAPVKTSCLQGWRTRQHHWLLCSCPVGHQLDPIHVSEIYSLLPTSTAIAEPQPMKWSSMFMPQTFAV